MVKKIIVQIREVGSKDSTTNDDYVDEETNEIVSLPRKVEAGWKESYEVPEDVDPIEYLDFLLLNYNKSTHGQPKREWVYYQFEYRKNKYRKTKIFNPQL